MSIDGEKDQNEELLLDDPIEENEEGEEQGGEAGQAEPKDGEGDDLDLTIDGEEDGDESYTIRVLRDELRSTKGQLHDLKKAQGAPKDEPIGKKPDLWEDCDGDPDKYETALLSWHQANSRKQEQQANEQAMREKNDREFEKFRSRVRTRAETFGVKDYDAAEQSIADALGDASMAGLAMRLARDPAKTIAAISKNPAALARLAKETDPIEKVKLVLDMESRINRKNPPPPPEASTIQRGSAPAAPVQGDKKEQALLAAAEKDPSKFKAYREYMKQKKAKGA